ncbi:hypothetical protein DHEL01_v209601 [Diaporthe helianthi]|uniref:Uncharacterized protein n=1 Tax=Diaporthe helianthi TaxID=158607 RepID=A0A2P5HP36_DIAHE|nr:hypothetical protein DHEL01_v209601 [Diaporthe helianthi]
MRDGLQGYQRSELIAYCTARDRPDLHGPHTRGGSSVDPSHLGALIGWCPPIIMTYLGKRSAWTPAVHLGILIYTAVVSLPRTKHCGWGLFLVVQKERAALCLASFSIAFLPVIDDRHKSSRQANHSTLIDSPHSPHDLDDPDTRTITEYCVLTVALRTALASFGEDACPGCQALLVPTRPVLLTFRFCASHIRDCPEGPLDPKLRTIVLTLLPSLF